eukprot:TRINITY_DN68067_c0_g1_i1.p1 TRINITY_DN68067_c0_g1~~TRINITY_DN68067_c0_g1_i1.p1  ORF type:complete len:488 (-),score=72.81 TRINITY_DN68067_c0_g1_i1:62-1414(-)
MAECDATSTTGLSWLSSLPSCTTSQTVDEGNHDGSTEVVTNAAENSIDEKDAVVNALVAAGFSFTAASAALEAAGGDSDEALATLVAESRRAVATEPLAKRHRGHMTKEHEDDKLGETIEIEGVQCRLTKQGEVTLRLPHDPTSPGPIVGHCNAAGEIVFNGMDEWLWELYDSHLPRSRSPLPPSFDAVKVADALKAGKPYVWDSFADEGEIRAAHAEFEAMFSRNQLSRGSGFWVDECAEGGHARNRRTLEGQKRDDACGFWDLQGGQPAPPPAIFVLLRRLEAIGEKLRAVHGWPLLCSRWGMGAVYDGKGASYSPHRDNEWQRHMKSQTPVGCDSTAEISDTARRGEGAVTPPGAWMNFRELSMLAYVNLPGQFGEDEAGVQAGGRLRCYNATKRGDLKGDSALELQNVAPVGGRAVIFRAREMLHEVLPSFGRRFALLVWFQTPEY